jgi:uncharacterized membrane protein YfcA
MELSILAIVITFFSSLIGTISGFGISTIMIPVLVTSYSLPQVLLFVAIIHLANDIWKLILFHNGIRWHLLLYFGLAGFFASIFGALLTIRLGMSPYFIQTFGLFLVMYALFLVLKPKFAFKETPTTLLQGGAVSGFFYGLFGMGGLLRGMVLISFNMDKAVYLATSGAISLIIDVTRVVVYRASGLVIGSNLLVSLLICIPISFIGAKAGEKIIQFVPQKQFRLMVSGFILLMGIKLVLKI